MDERDKRDKRDKSSILVLSTCAYDKCENIFRHPLLTKKNYCSPLCRKMDRLVNKGNRRKGPVSIILNNFNEEGKGEVKI